MNLHQRLLAEGEKHKGTDLGGLLQFAEFQVRDMVQVLTQVRRHIAQDRANFAAGCTAPNGAVEPEDWVFLGGYDALLSQIDGTIHCATADE